MGRLGLAAHYPGLYKNIDLYIYELQANGDL